MKEISFADVAHNLITFNADEPSESSVLALIDTPWMQRLRDISQTANTRLVYMFSEHSRFGHSVGVAYLAATILSKLLARSPELVAPYRTAVLAAALMHDVGHLAPGSHTAFKTWYPDQEDIHEEISAKIIRSDPAIGKILTNAQIDLVVRILSEDPTLPPWTWEIISGGGWNVDRGNWCIVDSVMAGVSYGKYNIPALTESIVISDDGHLALRENRLDAMIHFAISRHAMYRQIYQHRVILAADTINMALVKRVREMQSTVFCDDEMRAVLQSKTAAELSLDTIFKMRESWWRYHVMRWSESNDPVIRDLCNRIITRRLFKTIRISPADNEQKLRAECTAALQKLGLSPEYYLHDISTYDTHGGDTLQSMLVRFEDGPTRTLRDAEPIFAALVSEQQTKKRWLVVPGEVKKLIGRER